MMNEARHTTVGWLHAPTPRRPEHHGIPVFVFPTNLPGTSVRQTDPSNGSKYFYNRQWYYFANLDSRVRFMAAPEKYVQG